mmetsp:Transcript_44137/g.116676  ORF Transcript_44137/g.116676 Transcript_44137/m.116676 type:complete len:158 (-) Transcript_44137:74-547(-)
MAGHAEKKQAKNASSTIQYYLYGILGVNALYFVWRVLLHWDSMGKWNLMGMLLFVGVSYVTYKAIDSSLQMGGNHDWFNDMFFVNIATQFLVTFTDWGWLLYLVVPGYLGWKVLKMVLDYVFTPTEAEMDQNDPRYKKKMEKKERQAERPKFKVSKR